MKEISELGEKLSQSVGGRTVTMAVEDSKVGLIERLGSEWFSALLDPVQLVWPENSVVLHLLLAKREPMHIGEIVEDDDFNSFGSIVIAGDSNLPTISRLVSIPSDDLLDDRIPFKFIDADSGIRRKIGDFYTLLYRKTPLLLDVWRQTTNDRRSWSVEQLKPDFVFSQLEFVKKPVEDRPTAWFAMHWLEGGGAESWALESLRLAKEAGFQTIVTVDQAAPQRLLAQVQEISDHVYLAANVLALEDWNAFIGALFSKFDIKIVHIHHSARAYEYLPILKQLSPEVFVVDSTHIIEHRTGGFVRVSIMYDDFIDLHHVISPELRDEYLLGNKIPREKICYAPLTQMDQQQPDAEPTVRDPSQPLTIGFLGRLAAQKRPFLFLELVRRLNKRYPGRFRFVMQGSGALVKFVDELSNRFGISDVIERREWGPVAEFFDEIDILLITSDNEGLTLTALEADAHGVLVASADVGSQITVIAPEVLFPRYPLSFLSAAVKALVKISENPELYQKALKKQRKLHKQLLTIESATETFGDLFRNQFSKVTL